MLFDGCNNKKFFDVCFFCYILLLCIRDMQDIGMLIKCFDKKYWKMVVVLLVICGVMLLFCWVVMIWG